MSDKDMEERIKKLEARVQELEDERGIRELLARYGYNADTCRDDAYVNLYTEDGVVSLTQSHHGEKENRWEGHEEIRKFITNPTGHQAPGFYGHAMHVQGNNVVCHIKGNEAVVNSYSIVLHDDKNNLRLKSAGNNQWTLRKVDGIWLFKERRRRHVGGGQYIGNLDATPK